MCSEEVATKLNYAIIMDPFEDFIEDDLFSSCGSESLASLEFESQSFSSLLEGDETLRPFFPNSPQSSFGVPNSPANSSASCPAQPETVEPQMKPSLPLLETWGQFVDHPFSLLSSNCVMNLSSLTFPVIEAPFCCPLPVSSVLSLPELPFACDTPSNSTSSSSTPCFPHTTVVNSKKNNSDEIVVPKIPSQPRGRKPKRTTFPCTICGKIFNNESNRRRHVLIHSGAKPFPCSVCGKSFNNCSNRNTHEKIHFL